MFVELINVWRRPVLDVYMDKAAHLRKEQVEKMQVVNKGVEEGETPVINSRYSIVMATAKRARQIVDGDEPLIDYVEGDKPLSIAVEELNQEKIHILAENESEEEKEILDAEAAEEMEADSTEGDEITE